VPHRLAKFVHVSDLHFGPSRIPAMRLDPEIARALQRLPYADGLLGHDLQALEALEDFVDKRARVRGDLIVTGDLTRVGSQAELFLAIGVVGALSTRWRDLTIPGNHDRWGGRALAWVETSPMLGALLPGGALEETRIALPTPAGPVLTLRILRLDTECDLPLNGRWERTLARGRFSAGLATAMATVRPLPAPQVTVLLMHHSPLHPARKGDSSLQKMIIDDPSLEALRDLCRQAQVQVILCGHTHRLSVDDWLVPGLADPVRVVCCGSTTQMQRDPPVDWLLQLPARTRGVNELLLHDLIQSESGLWWLVRAYECGAEPYAFVRKRIPGAQARLRGLRWAFRLQGRQAQPRA
jgi:3',5'-cyclic AMP phosphodiesterase CpdA